MEKLLLLVAVVIVACIASSRFSRKIGVPGLFVFIVLGMIFGTDGIFKIGFENYDFANVSCSIALIFIMFYGGAGTKWSAAKPVAVKAILLSSLGTVMTAALVGGFCYFVLGFELLEGLLMGAVICSTDAASVFSILRSRRMNLKYQTASLLEVESGSNDPFSYMLAVVILSLMRGESYSVWGTVWMLVLQIVVGIGCGFIIAFITKAVLNRFKLKEAGLDTAFIIAMAVASYAIPTLIKGNGYLSAYIAGIVIGNAKIPNKKEIINFLDGVTGIMQMLLFFELGLLAFPSYLPTVALTALMIALFLTFIARPIAVFLVMTPFKCNIRQQLFVAWSGMRGAASIVFAIMAVTDSAFINNDIFHIVFFIVLFSILVQGTLLPAVAKRLDMIDEEGDVMKTFTDYAEEVPVQFIEFNLHEGHPWIGKEISEIVLPPESILVLIVRNGEKIVPKGNTALCLDDILILSGKEGSGVGAVNLYEVEVTKGHWSGKQIYEVATDERLIVLVKRKENVIIPKGNTVLENGDICVINDMSYIA